MGVSISLSLANGGFSAGRNAGGAFQAPDANASDQPTGQAHAWRGAPAHLGVASHADGATTWLTNGDRVVSSQTSSGNSNYQVHVQLYSPQGAPIGPAFSETAPPVTLFTAPVVTGLADGSYEAAWVQQGNYASHLLAEHFTAHGTAAGQATLATYGGFSVIGSSGYAVAGLSDGDFVAAWTVQDNSGSPPQVWAEAFTGSGAPVGSATPLGTAASPGQAPAIEAEANGHYVVSWNSPGGPEHQALTDQGAAAAATHSPAGADVSGAHSSGSEWGGLSALHPFATDPSHAMPGLHAYAASFGFL
jgi:hypothetical protein